MENFYKLTVNILKNMSINSILDILVVSFIFYKAYVLIEETRAEQLLKGLVLIVILIPISDILKLNMLNFILNKTLTIGVLSVVIIFQPEIRRALEHLGRSAFEDIHSSRPIENRNEVIEEITTAVDNLAATKTGALIAMEQGTGLSDILSKGTVIDAKVSASLLENIFVVNTPLHDGATIIRKGRIHASGCVLPLTNNTKINKKLGTRHRAALGIAEESDAIALVVSEETGRLSIAVDSNLHYNLDPDQFRMMLIDELKPKMEVFFEADDESEGDEEW